VGGGGGGGRLKKSSIFTRVADSPSSSIPSQEKISRDKNAFETLFLGRNIRTGSDRPSFYWESLREVLNNKRLEEEAFVAYMCGGEWNVSVARPGKRVTNQRNV